jgi:hypothetical protein
MSLFELFPPQNDPQDCSQLLPPDPTLPGSEIEKAWFTYIDDTMTSDRCKEAHSHVQHQQETTISSIFLGLYSPLSIVTRFGIARKLPVVATDVRVRLSLRR